MKLTPSKPTNVLPLKPAGAVLKLAPAQPVQQRWGSPEEVYRRFCYLVLAHRYLYYVEHRPVLQDFEYDLMERYLVHLEKTTGVFHDQSPVRTVGSSEHETYPKTSSKWAQKILDGQVDRSVYYIDHLSREDWQKYLNSLPLDR